MRLFRILWLLYFFVALCYSEVQSQTKVWQKVFGREGNDAFYSVVATPDGGVACLGYTDRWIDSIGHTILDNKALFAKLDANGKIEWQRAYWDTKTIWDPEGLKIIEESPNGYILAGKCILNAPCLIYVQNDGQLRKIVHFPSDTIQGKDGVYLIETECAARGLGDIVLFGGAIERQQDTGLFSIKDNYVVKADTNGVMEWVRRFPFADNAGEGWITGVAQLANGTIVAVGWNWCFTSQGEEVIGCVIGLDKDGNELWIQRDLNHEYWGVNPTKDGGFVVAGMDYTTGKAGASAGKYTFDGSNVWKKTIRNGYETGFYQVKEARKGGYIGVGIIANTQKQDSYVARLTEIGDVLWNVTAGGKELEWSYSVAELSSGGFVTVGESTSYTSSPMYSDAFVFMVSDTASITSVPNYSNEENGSIAVYPSLAKDEARIEFSLLRESSVRLLMTNVLGNEIPIFHSETPLSAGKHSLLFDCSKLVNGVYWLRLQMGNGETAQVQCVIAR